MERKRARERKSVSPHPDSDVRAHSLPAQTQEGHQQPLGAEPTYKARVHAHSLDSHRTSWSQLSHLDGPGGPRGPPSERGKLEPAHLTWSAPAQKQPKAITLPLGSGVAECLGN